MNWPKRRDGVFGAVRVVHDATAVVGTHSSDVGGFSRPVWFVRSARMTLADSRSNNAWALSQPEKLAATRLMISVFLVLWNSALNRKLTSLSGISESSAWVQKA